MISCGECAGNQGFALDPSLTALRPVKTFVNCSMPVPEKIQVQACLLKRRKPMLEQLKKEVYEANMLLPRHQLVTFTWGNVSGIDREAGLYVIKPSGVPYEQLAPEDMVVMDLNGRKVEGKMNPSSDTPTHTVLYNRFPGLGGIVHTHSRWATIWAQAGREIPAYGTTHADYIYGPVPITRALTQEEVERAYEMETGHVIASHFEDNGIDTAAVPCVLVRNHGPFTWGKDAIEAVHNAVVLEEVAMMAWHTEALPGGPSDGRRLPEYVKEKHYTRKHGPNAYYGQK